MDIARDGQEAIDLVEKNLYTHPYGLIISDCQMPVKDGYESCMMIRDSYTMALVSQPYIVAVTGNAESS